eukprot:symbB.v1.2.008632.t1/scaffold516.1/size216213/18
MGNFPITTCNKVLSCDLVGVGETICQASRSIRHDEDVQLALKVEPSRNSLKMGEELLISSIKKVPGWDPLTWRQERVARQQVTGQTSQLWPSLTESRLGRPQRAWSVEILASDGHGGVRTLHGLLQVAHVKGAVEEIGKVADYAHRFNRHVATVGGEGPDVPTIRVASSVACFVLDSINPDIASAGDTVVLTLFDAKQVTKFVFEGVVRGQGLLPLCALEFERKGTQQEQDLLLVDPVLISTSDLDIGELISLATSNVGSDFQTHNRQRFDLWHPRCAQLCQSFDPQRRGGNTRRACGVPLPSCGVGGG